MTSPAANLFLALRTLIANLADGQGNPYFRYVDQDLGQLEMERPPVLWPCVLIDIDEMSFRNMTDAAQLGTVKVVLRLGFPPLGSAASWNGCSSSPSTTNFPGRVRQHRLRRGTALVVEFVLARPMWCVVVGVAPCRRQPQFFGHHPSPIRRLAPGEAVDRVYGRPMLFSGIPFLKTASASR